MPAQLVRSPSNPIIVPKQNWEALGTFNPGVVESKGAIHILYRGVDADERSRFGYARTSDGTDILERATKPVLGPELEWEGFGCEDPRITQVDGTFYIAYTAYSSHGTRLALASTEDFLKFERYGLIGPNRNDKDFVIFPERIDGQIAILHRIGFGIQIAYFETFEAMKNSQSYWSTYMKHLKDYEVMKPKTSWESFKVGAGPPPIKTKDGWLLIYHGVSGSHVYSAGAALLDLEEPTKVIARTKNPILEPKFKFEEEGAVPNVVFPEGAVVRGKDLLVYYGAADKVCCLASAPLDQFLEELKKEIRP